MAFYKNPQCLTHNQILSYSISPSTILNRPPPTPISPSNNLCQYRQLTDNHNYQRQHASSTMDMLHGKKRLLQLEIHNLRAGVPRLQPRQMPRLHERAFSQRLPL